MDDPMTISLQADPVHTDVLIVGAGLSGIGAAYHLQRDCPDRSYAIVDRRSALGGTWDLFRYPGIRSDSDMHTLGYSFKPWTDPKSIADGPSILAYVQETAEENGIDQHIVFDSLVETADWSGDEARWTLTITNTETGQTTARTCNFLLMCAGYYSYRGGHRPSFAGEERFSGPVIHPQEWPEDLDYADKLVVVIGSGATAVTLVPAMADDAEHVTMLQRSPTYVVARPDTDKLANAMAKVLPDKLAYRMTRAKNAWQGEFFYNQTRKKPAKIKKMILDGARDALGSTVDVDTHFNPAYNPWDQRLCLVPNGDLFEALKDGSASVVTDSIESFDETGITLASGDHLDADIIVTATGLELVTLGEVAFSIEGEPVDFADTFTYKGLAYSGVPNLVATFGYINASWTLRADLISDYVSRLLNYMTEIGADEATPQLRESDADMIERPWIDDFSASYMQRTMEAMPRQGDRAPWLNTQRLSADRKLIGDEPIADGVMQFAARGRKSSNQGSQKQAS